MTAQSPTEAGKPTEAYKDAWSSIQAMVMVDGASWSGREKNCVFLNTGGREFANVSSISHADYSDDSRAVVSVDWDDDGRMDLVIKNRTAPRLRLMRNQGTDTGGFLKIDLVGTECNRDAIGATVVVDLGERELRKTIFAGDGYLSQSSKQLHFGLAEARRVKKLTVKWPGGADEVFEDLAGNARYRIVQGLGTLAPVAARTHADFATLTPAVEERLDDRVERIVLVDKLPMNPVVIPSFDDPRRKVKDYGGGPLLVNLWESTCAACIREFADFEERLDDSVERIVLVDKLPMNPVAIPSFDDPKRKVKDYGGGPLLVNLWESTCAACIREFADFEERGKELAESGLRIVTLTKDEGPRLADARRILDRFGLSEEAGYVDGNLQQTLEVFLIEILTRVESIGLPTSLLIDKAGQLAVIYPGAIDVDVLLEDVAVLKRSGTHRRTVSLSGGLWFKRDHRDLALLSEVFGKLGRGRLSTYYDELSSGR